MKQKFAYRVGLDIGTNSIGWAVLKLNDQGAPINMHRLGVRIFSDGREAKTAASLAAARRLKRQMRRRHDRVLKRQKHFMQALLEAGLMPKDEDKRKALSQLDPYSLRAKALDFKLTPEELGRALYHLCKRRGFQSSRKEQTEDKNESGKIAKSIQHTMEMIASTGCRTYGEYLAQQHKEGKPVRSRSTVDGKGYIHYPQRAMVADEFRKIWEAQKAHHPTLCTDKAMGELLYALLFQRKLRPVEPGTCIFEESEPRIPQCSPLQQKFRILQELNNIRIGRAVQQRPLDIEERDRIKKHLLERKTLSFSEFRKLLGVPADTPINLESEKRKFLKGDSISAGFASSDCLGQRWWKLSDIQQEALALLVENAINSDELAKALKTLPETSVASEIIRGESSRTAQYLKALGDLPWALPSDAIKPILKISPPDGYANLSRKALTRIVDELDKDVITYNEAVLRAGYGSHSEFYDGVLHSRLPYYGELLKSYTSPMPNAKNSDEKRYGRLPNPTVHIGLNQLRLLLNEMIRRWGHPTEIVVELAREFGLSGQRRKELEKEQLENQDRNERLNSELRQLGQRENRENRQRLMLWYELGKDDALDRHCIYTGTRLNRSMLFSPEVEIDHILPYSRTLDDGLGNKILCLSKANRIKRNQSPFEAFSHSPTGYDWNEILERASRLSRYKAARFKESALSDYINRSALDKDALSEYGFSESDGFLARHLTDTAYLSRLSRRYLTAICPPNKVWVVAGRLTGKLRYSWNLDSILDESGAGKNRNDHRHHAIDAAVVASCDRSTIQRMANAAKRAESAGQNRLLADLEMPWETFRDELMTSVSKILVSHRANHAREASLHNDTNYGFREGPDKPGGASLFVHRVPILSIESAASAQKIYDPVIREKVIEKIGSATKASAKRILEQLSSETGIRNIRVAERLTVIPISDRRTGEVYRYVKGDGNYCYDIFRKDNGGWDGVIVSNFEANSKGFSLRPEKAANGMPLLMRLRKGDLIILEEGQSHRVMRVANFTDGKLRLAAHQESNVDSRDRDKSDPFSYLLKAPSTLKNLKARIVGVDILGYLNDPGYSE